MVNSVAIYHWPAKIDKKEEKKNLHACVYRGVLLLRGKLKSTSGHASHSWSAPLPVAQHAFIFPPVFPSWERRWMEAGGRVCFMPRAGTLSRHTSDLLPLRPRSSVPPGTKPALIKTNLIAQRMENGPHYYSKQGVKFLWDQPVFCWNVCIHSRSSLSHKVDAFLFVFPFISELKQVQEHISWESKCPPSLHCSSDRPQCLIILLHPVCNVIANQKQGLVWCTA